MPLLPNLPSRESVPEQPWRGTTFDGGREGWQQARRWGGRPDLEWSFPIMVERVWALSGRIPRFFYEPLGSWDGMVYALYLAHESRQLVGSPFVTIGFRYFDRFYRTRDGRLALPIEGEKFRGRHMVQVTGLDHDSLVFSNTWGDHWGNRGYGTMSRDYFEMYADNVSLALYGGAQCDGARPIRPGRSRMPQNE